MVQAIKVFALFFALIFILPFIAASATIGQNYNITISCKLIDCTKANITVLNPNTSALATNQSMTDYGSYATYQVVPQAFGQYTYYITDLSNYTSGTFSATSTGQDLSTGTSLVYGILIMLFLVIFIAIGVFAVKLPDDNEKDSEGRIISITWMKYLKIPMYFIMWILFLAIIFLAQNVAYAYLGEQLFSNLLFNLFRIGMLLTPLIVILWGVLFFIKFFQDKSFQNMLNRGFYPETKRL